MELADEVVTVPTVSEGCLTLFSVQTCCLGEVMNLCDVENHEQAAEEQVSNALPLLGATGNVNRLKENPKMKIRTMKRRKWSAGIARSALAVPIYTLYLHTCGVGVRAAVGTCQ